MGRATGGERRGAEVEFDAFSFTQDVDSDDVESISTRPAKDALSKFGVMKIR